ncbi:MAG TPA: hypothetical protein VFN44_02590 [Solirubrobacteraceae bacterium]|nr:hypothetical protein [Solirubrobacteraceae bacterium]
MGYVIAAIVLLLLVAAFVTFLVLNATRRAGGAGPRRPHEEGRPAGIAAPDESPLGDTAEHSGATEHEGRAEGAEGEQRPRVGDPGPEAVAAEPGRRSDRPS